MFHGTTEVPSASKVCRRDDANSAPCHYFRK